MAVALEEILEAQHPCLLESGAGILPASRAQAGKMPTPLSSGLLKRASGPIVWTTSPQKQSNLRPKRFLTSRIVPPTKPKGLELSRRWRLLNESLILTKKLQRNRNLYI